MNRTTVIKLAKRLALGLAALAIAATPSFAQTTVDLCATTGTAEVITGVSVDIWGFVDITAGGDCATAVATLPNPVIRATTGETLTINVTNNLGQPVSFFVPGMPNPAPTGLERFTTEVGAGGMGAYTFNLTGRSGTFLYHSATDKIRTHVPMGLYGALVVDSAVGFAYPGVPYGQDEVLVYSAIDPTINADPVGSTGARVAKDDDFLAEGWNADESGWNPQYFLINGKAHPDTDSLDVTPGDEVLLRFVNAGLDSVMPTLEGGLYMDLIAEDGNLSPAKFSQYGLELTAGKTIDAMVSLPTSERDYALYDRALSLTNGTALGGGMLTYLNAMTPVGAPTAEDDLYSVDEDNVLTADGITPNPAGVLDNDTGGAVEVVLVDPPSHDPAFILNPDGTFVYTPEVDFWGSDSFTYVANDGAGGDPSNTAVVTITVNPIDDGPPTAVADDYITSQDVALSVPAPGVLGNDTDPDNDMLTAAIGGTTPTDGVLVLNSDGSLTYTPNALFAGSDSFTYTAFDGTTASLEATVTIVVEPGSPINIPPVAVNDDYIMVQDTTLSEPAPGVLGNDTDTDGPLPLTAVLVDPPAFGVVGPISTGGFDYTPNAGFVGSDSFTYRAFDGEDNSNLATVTIEVTVPPIRAYFSTLGGGNNNPIQGVAAPYDDADIYTWHGTVFGRLFDGSATGLAGNADIDGFVHVSDTEFYVSFNADGLTLPGEGGDADAEDIVHYVDGVWSLFFDGSLHGLDNNAGQNIDAFDIVGGVLYFSTLGGGDQNLIPGVAAPYDDADIYTWDGTAFGRVFDANITAGLPGNADIDGLTVVDSTTFYMSFVRNAGTSVPDIGTVQDEDIVLYSNGTWSLPFIGADYGLNATNGQDIDALDYPPIQAYISTLGGGNNSPVQDVAAPYDDADIYTWHGTYFDRFFDGSAAGLPGNADIDGFVHVSHTEFYASFNRNLGTTVTGIGAVQDEDIVHYVDGVWSLYFDGSLHGLDNANGQDIDAFDIVGGVLYFSTLGGGVDNAIPGVAAPWDDADIYTWDGATFGRVFDASASGLPGVADINALTVVDSTTFYMSFVRNGGTAVPGIGIVQDEDIVFYDGGTWSLPFVGADYGLDADNGQDIDALDYVH